MWQIIAKLWTKISLRRRWQLLGLLLLMFFCSFAEILSIGALLPFLVALMSPEVLISNHNYLFFLATVPLNKIQVLLTVVFCISVFSVAIMRVLLSWVSSRLAYAIGADFSYQIYFRTLHQPYSVHISRNSSHIISGVTSKVNAVVSGVINPVIFLLNSVLVLIAILTVLILIDFSLTLYIFFGFGLVYLAVVVCTRNVKKTGGALVATQTTNILRALHEGLGGIRDTLLAGNQKFYCEIYRAADKPLRSAQGKLQFISQSPKYVTEALAMIIISIAILLIAQREGGLLAIMPALAALILGAQRLLPVMQTAYASWTAITFSKDVLQDVLCLMSQPLGNFDSSEIIESIQFNRKIVLSNVSFKYANSESKILTNVNLTINKGDRIGIFGETGGGKSTLIDVIMGLLQPSNGSISVDGVEITPLNLRAWQKHIANVPQNIYLSDGTMAENIAFGLSESELDFKKVKIAAQKAQIANYIEGLPDGYDARCGERGASLSGGQIQRIGIARALYKNADVLVFDEATSALDSATENAIISFMESLDKDITIIIVAHRLATIRKCNKFFEIRKGREPRVCNHEDVFK